jgi:hypothetical protein
MTRYAAQGEQEIGAITFLHGGPEVIAAGSAGLAVLRGGQFRRLNAADPDVLSRVSGMVIGANGDRWFNGSKGVVQVRAADWQAAVAAPQQPLEVRAVRRAGWLPGFAATASACPARLPMPMASCGLPASAASPELTARARIRRAAAGQDRNAGGAGNRYLDFAQAADAGGRHHLVAHRIHGAQLHHAGSAALPLPAGRRG